jgi:hypothetical protein
MRDENLVASQPRVLEPDAPGLATPVPGHLPVCEQAAPGGVLCRDGAYPGIVAAVRKAVERNVAFGC